MVEALLHEIAEDPDLKSAGLLWVDSRTPEKLHKDVNDSLVQELVLTLFDDYDFYKSPLDVLGVVFESLARLGEKDTRVGQFFTPQAVVDFCAEIVGLSPRDTVLDPAVGTARFLIAAMDRMLRNASLVPGDPQQVQSDIRKQKLFGADIDDWVSRIAKMNMFIHGDGKSHMLDANGLTLADRPIFDLFPNGMAESIDIVLTNPPLGNTSFIVALEAWAARAPSTPTPQERITFLRGLGVVPLHAASVGRQEKRKLYLQEKVNELAVKLSDARAEPLTPARGKKIEKLTKDQQRHIAAYASALAAQTAQSESARGEGRKGGALFLGAIASYLKRLRDPSVGIEWQGGRAVVIVDEAILNTPDYGDVRQFIRDNYFVKAVVSLGRPAFKYLAHTDAKTSALFLIRKPLNSIHQQEPIFFAHAERVGYSASGKWIGNDLPGLLNRYNTFKEAVLASYAGAYFDGDKCRAALTLLDGFRASWHARLDAVTGDGRLDYFHARGADVLEQFAASGAELIPLSELLEVRVPATPSPSRTGEYDFAVADRKGNVTPKGRQQVDYSPSELWEVKQGDLIVSGIDLVKGAAGVAGGDVDGLVMSKEMYAYRVKKVAEARPEYVAMLLRTDVSRALIEGLVSGTSNRTRLTDAEQLLKLQVPKPPTLTEQDSIVYNLRSARTAVKLGSSQLDQILDEIAAKWPVQTIAVTGSDPEDDGPDVGS